MTTIRAVVFVANTGNRESLISGIPARLQRGGISVVQMTYDGRFTVAGDVVPRHRQNVPSSNADMPSYLVAWAVEQQLLPSELLVCFLDEAQQLLESSVHSLVQICIHSETTGFVIPQHTQTPAQHEPVSLGVWRAILPGAELVRILMDNRQGSHESNSGATPGTTFSHAWMEIPALANPTMLFQHIININLTRQPGLLIVGYAMKATRESDLARSGLLNLVPQDGIVCMPLDFCRPLTSQMPVHLLLHKASDELMQTSSGQPFQFSANIAAMQMFSLEHPSVCVVDAFNSMDKVIDRIQLSQLTEGLENLRAGDSCLQQMRSPRYATCASATEAFTVASTSGLQPPLIVKSSIACGLAGAHAMVLVLTLDGLKKLEMEGSLVLQEFVNHGGVVHKVYVAGCKVFCTTRPSIPDIIGPLTATPELVYFDSLKNLPVGNASLGAAGQNSTGDAAPSPAAGLSDSDVPAQALELDVDSLQCIADYLRSQFHLTLFGFDVILGSLDQVLYVIDVNYFPHFKGIPSAAGHVREALKMAHTKHCLGC